MFLVMENHLEPFSKLSDILKVNNRVEPKLQFYPLVSYSSSTLFLTFRWVWDFWNGPKWFPMVQNMGLESKIKAVEGSEQKL